LAVPTLLLAFGLDTCQASVNWSLAFWTPTYLTRYHIAPSAEMAAIALLPAILGFVLGAVLGGWLIDRLRHRTQLAPVWVALLAMSGGLLAALLVFNIFQLAALMTAAFFMGLITYLVMPAVTIIEFSVVPPETKASTISASNVILNLVIAVLSLLIGVVSDAAGLRLAFGGVVIVMYALGIVVCLALLRTFRQDMAKRNAVVETRVVVQ
jgi:MFS family permease